MIVMLQPLVEIILFGVFWIHDILSALEHYFEFPSFQAEEAHIHQAVCLVLLGEVDMALEFLARVEGSRRYRE